MLILFEKILSKLAGKQAKNRNETDSKFHRERRAWEMVKKRSKSWFFKISQTFDTWYGLFRGRPRDAVSTLSSHTKSLRKSKKNSKIAVFSTSSVMGVPQAKNSNFQTFFPFCQRLYVWRANPYRGETTPSPSWNTSYHVWKVWTFVKIKFLTLFWSFPT